jgi:monoterpene epsilon-lactone hydrolase
MSLRNLALTWYLRNRVKPLSLVQDVEKIRATARRLALKPRVPKGWRVRELLLPPMHGEWIEPNTKRDSDPTAGRTILYLHGGGYFFNSPQTHRAITFALAKGAGARLFALDYRLAPEFPFPAALDDAVAAYRRLLHDGIAPENLIVAGDSAGGGLVLATLVALRDQGDPLPAGAVLFSPWTDLAVTGASVAANEPTDALFYAEGLRHAVPHYLGGEAPTHPLISPLYADLKGLPPLFIQASDSEVLLDDSTRLVEKAREAGVHVMFKTWPRLPHVWQVFAPFLPEGRAALAEAAAFIHSRLD